MEYGEPGLDLLPEEAISTSTRTLLASPGVADPGNGGPWGWRAVTDNYIALHLERIKSKLVENQDLALKFEQKNTSSRFALILLKRQ